jgi:hypothetical protein
MTEQPVPTSVITAFYVVVDETGNISVHGDSIPSVVVKHKATLTDVEIYGAAVSRLASRMLIESALAQPIPPTVSERVADALAKRAD